MCDIPTLFDVLSSCSAGPDGVISRAGDGPEVENAEAMRPLILHAHPDDETLWTGTLLAWCADHGIDAAVLTLTRGEEGSAIEGSLPEGSTIVEVRDAERKQALAALGTGTHGVLGSGLARANLEPDRVYRDSGMQWLNSGLAGPADTADESTLTAAALDDAVADAIAYAEHIGATELISYDAFGSYGHPDHVRAHEIAAEAARRTGLPLTEIASAHGPEDYSSFTRFDLSAYTDTMKEALGAYATQLRVDGDTVTHVGEQQHPIDPTIRLRRVDPAHAGRADEANPAADPFTEAGQGIEQT